MKNRKALGPNGRGPTCQWCNPATQPGQLFCLGCDPERSTPPSLCQSCNVQVLGTAKLCMDCNLEGLAVDMAGAPHPGYRCPVCGTGVVAGVAHYNPNTGALCAGTPAPPLGQGPTMLHANGRVYHLPMAADGPGRGAMLRALQHRTDSAAVALQRTAEQHYQYRATGVWPAQ